MPRHREIDPLLPQTDPSPEISGYGSSRPKSNYELEYKYLQQEQEQQKYAHSVEVHDINDHSTANDKSSNSGSIHVSRPPRSVWNSIIATFTFIVLFAFAASLLNPSTSQPTPVPIHDPESNRPNNIDARVKKILTSTPLIDGHNDLAYWIRVIRKNNIHTPDFKSEFESGTFPGEVDLHRLRKGMVGGAFWSAFVFCSANASLDFTDEQYATYVAHTIEQVDLIKRLQALYPSNWTAAGHSLDENLRRFHETRSLIGPISIEGLHQVSQKSAFSTLRLYYDLGVRAATLTWNCHNAFADAAILSTYNSTVMAPNFRNGITDKGRKVIREMNRLGMLVDISHTSFWTQKSVLEGNTSLAPVIYSHSSAYSLCPHPRNVHDSNLDLVRKTKSLVMVNFSPDFISCTGGDATNLTLPAFYPANNTLHQIARHITYIGDRIGYDYVGIGSDFDGMGSLKPRGLEDVSKFPDLIAELLKMGVKDVDVEKVVGGNLVRVWQEAEKIRDELQKRGVLPELDEVFGG